MSAGLAVVIGKLYSFGKIYYFSYALLINEVMDDGPEHLNNMCTDFEKS